jgi:hypothetical protein
MTENNLPVVDSVYTTAQIEELQNQAFSMELQQKFATIVAEMRENPLPPSEEVKKEDSNALIRVELPPEGGVLTYMTGFDAPYQGFPYHNLVISMELIKKMTKGFKSGFYHYLWKWFEGKYWRPMIFLTSPFYRVYSRAELHACWRYLERHKIKPKRYSRSIRELYRAFSVPVIGENNDQREIRERIRDLACMHLEFDNAYRFRFQDVIVNIDKGYFEKHPVNEMLRMFDLMTERETRQEVKDSWKLTKIMVEYLRYDKAVLKIYKSLIKNLNLEECALDDRDWPFCKERKDYKFKNANFQQKLNKL